MSNAITGLGPISSQLGGSGGTAAAAGGTAESDFMKTLRSAMEEVGDLQNEADGKVAQLLTGNGQDVHSTMIAVQKASLAFEMMLEVRNKILAAYQQISGIPL